MYIILGNNIIVTIYYEYSYFMRMGNEHSFFRNFDSINILCLPNFKERFSFALVCFMFNVFMCFQYSLVK